MPRTSHDDEWLTPPEVAAILKMSVDAVRKQLWLGKIPGDKKNGTRWGVWRSKLDAYMQDFAPPNGKEPHTDG